jgi:hypothetical protein
MRYIYGLLVVINMFFASLCFMGFVLALCAWDIESVGICAALGSILIFFSVILADEYTEKK